MKSKIISMVMSVFILAQSFNIHLVDLLQVDDLLEHMELHKETYGDNLISFVSKHYGWEMDNHQRETENDKEHGKLPFHRSMTCDSFQVFIVNTDALALDHTPRPTQRKSNFYYNNFYSFLENKDIFQPPRLA